MTEKQRQQIEYIIPYLKAMTAEQLEQLLIRIEEIIDNEEFETESI